ncbi:MAG: hypothetical protein KF690_11925 [Bacteroidetes bacterium]|nr:hypothetical protein [Bacteroidota bacterium]
MKTICLGILFAALQIGVQAQTETRITWDPELGKVTELIARKDGVRHGTQVWLLNGIMYRKEYWEYDRLVGPVEEYWANGHIKARYGVDREGRLDGACYRYYSNRKPLEAAHYAHGALLPGSLRTYYPNGRVAAIRCYRQCEVTPAHGALPDGVPWPLVGVAPGPGLQSDSTWVLYNYRGKIHRQRDYSCGNVLREQQFADFQDTLVGGTNPSLADFTLKNFLVGLDSAGYPLVVKMKGRYERRTHQEAWANRRKWINKELVESYFISRMRNTEALKTYYEGGRTRSSLIHQMGAPTRQGATFYSGTQRKETWTEDLGGSRMGEYTHYWANGREYIRGYYVQDSTRVLRMLTLTDRGEKTEVPLHPSLKHGTWRYYDYDGALVREEYWEMGQLRKE